MFSQHQNQLDFQDSRKKTKQKISLWNQIVVK